MQANPYQAPAADLSAPVPGTFDESSPFSPSGRFGRLSYLAWSMGLGVILWAVLIAFVGVAVIGQPDADGGKASGVLAMAALFVVGLPLAMIFNIRRLHDFNASGWWVLLFFVPLVSAIFALVLLFRPGDAEANRFAAPRLTRSWEKVVGYIAIGVMVLAIVGIIAAIAIPILAAR